MTRAATALAAAFLLVAVTATPAVAHTRASSATNFHSEITEAPELDDVTWRVYPGGEYLEASNRSETPLVVLGYEGEPYLRIGPAGVERNRNSPAAYLNLDRYGDVAVPPRADPAAAPEWEHISASARHAWHDHRIHWMSSQPPEAVQSAPGTPADLRTWSVPFVYGDRPLALTGRLAWDPGPARWPWLLGALVVTAPALVGLRRARHDLRPAAAVLAAVALANLAHLPDEVAALPVPPLDVLFGLLHNMLFIGVGLGGAVLTWRGRSGSLLPLGIGSGAVLFHQGLLQVSQLGAAQLATVWPHPAIRVLVAASLAQAVWIALAVWIARRRDVRAPDRSGSASGGTLVPAEPALSTPDTRSAST